MHDRWAFLGVNLRIASWNCPGLCGSLTADGNKLSLKTKRLSELCEKHDVVCLQEAHCSEADCYNMNSRDQSFLWYSAPGAPCTRGGCLMGIRKQLFSRIQFLHKVLVVGRVHCLVGHGISSVLLIVNIHIEPGISREQYKNWWTKIITECQAHRDAVVVCIGDVNCVPEDEGRFDFCTGRHQHVDPWHDRALWDICHDLIEIDQPEPTRREVRDHVVVSVSKLDRCFMFGFSQDIVDMRPVLTTLGMASQMDKASDHVPISLHISMPHSKAPKHGNIPLWIVRHPLYERILTQAMEEADHDSDVNDQISFFKAAAKRSHLRFHEALNKQQASSVDEQLHFATLAFRGCRSGDRRAVERALAAMTKLLEFVDNVTASFRDASGLSSLIARLHRAKCDAQEADIEVELSDEQKVAKQRVVQKRRQVWAIKRRRLCLSQIVDATGAPFDTDEAAAEKLRRHWQDTAERGQVDTSNWDYMRRYIQKVPNHVVWELNYGEFLGAIRRRTQSAPGPDGLHYQVYLLNEACGARLLFKLYQEIVHGKIPPNDFLSSLMVFIPKGEDATDTSVISRSAENVRPLCLSNTDGKIITSAIALPMNAAGKYTVDHRQRGFVEGRCMIDNILDLESMGICAQLQNKRCAVFVFMDFAAAFPSIFHEWIMFVLECMGFPGWVLAFFSWIYQGSAAQVVYRGSRWGWIHPRRGVRQGCPAAAITFALALDPIFRWLADKALSMGNDIRGYADDLALFLQDYRTDMPRIALAFEFISKMAGLTLKIPKCVVVVLGTVSEESIVGWLSRNVDSFTHMRVALFAKYLGVQLGPGANDASWTSPMAKYAASVAMVRNLNLGLSRTIILYNRHCVSNLQFIAQLLDPTKQLVRQENRALDRLICAPRHAFNKDMLTSLKALGLGVQFTDVCKMAIAAKARVAASSIAFTVAETAIAHIRQSDEVILRAISSEWMPEWYNQSCLGALAKAKRYMHTILHSIPYVDRPAIDRKDFQKKTLELIMSRQPKAHVHGMLLTRMSKWLPPGVFPDIDGMTRRILRIGRRHNMWAPSVSILRVCTRGVCTAARFQNREAACVFGCGIGFDCLEHILVCGVVIQALKLLLERMGIRRHEHFLLHSTINHASIMMYDGKAGTTNQDTTSAILIDALVYTHGVARRSEIPLTADKILEVLMARVRHYRCLSRTMALNMDSMAQVGQVPNAG